MKLTMRGASCAAIAAVALAACGKQDADTSTSANETTAQAAPAEPDRTADTDAGLNEGPNDRYVAETHEATPGSTASVSDRPDAAGSMTGSSVADTGGTVDSSLDVANLRFKTDADKIAQLSFAAADSNKDGMLDQSEYGMLVKTAGQTAAPASTAAGAGDTTVDSTARQPQPNLPEAGSSETGVATAYQNAGGADGSITKEELRSAFLKRFDMADGDQNDELTDVERNVFARIMAGLDPDMRNVAPATNPEDPS